MASLTLSELMTRFETWAIKRLAPGTVLNYRRHFKRFLSAVGDLPAADLRKHHLIEWATTWHEFVSIQRLFNWAWRDAELLERTPFATIKRPRLGRRRRILEPSEAMKLFRASPRDLRALLFCLRESIARPQEARVFAWEHIRQVDQADTIEAAIANGRAYFELDDYKHRHLRADPDETRVVPITPRLGRLLLRIGRGSVPDRGIIFKTASNAAWTKEAIRLRMKRLRERLGIKLDKRGETIVAYTLRHTAATNACARGVRDRHLSSLMGHTTTRMTSRYQHLDTAHIVAAMRQVCEKKQRTLPPKAPDAESNGPTKSS